MAGNYRCPRCGQCWQVRVWPLSCACGHFTQDGSDSAVGDCAPATASPPQPPPVAPKEPVGAALKELRAEMGITDTLDCGCRELARKMDRWGIAGCRRHRRAILEHLAAAAVDRGWGMPPKAFEILLEQAIARVAAASLPPTPAAPAGPSPA